MLLGDHDVEPEVFEDPNGGAGRPAARTGRRCTRRSRPPGRPGGRRSPRRSSVRWAASHLENRSPANVGSGAERWIPRAFSATHRVARFWNAQLASGPTGPPDPAHRSGSSDEVVAQPGPTPHLALLDQASPGAGVDLGDLHPGRAGHVAHPAPRAVVDGGVRRRLPSLPESTALGPLVLGPGEGVGHRRHRANGHTDVALDAPVERRLDRLVVPGARVDRADGERGGMPVVG